MLLLLSNFAFGLRLQLESDAALVKKGGQPWRGPEERQLHCLWCKELHERFVKEAKDPDKGGKADVL